MTYDPKANVLQVLIDLANIDEYVGAQEIHLTLTDEKLNSNEYIQTLNIMMPEDETTTNQNNAMIQEITSTLTE